MPIERISDFLGGQYQKSYLQRIYLAQKLQQALQPDFGAVTVVVRNRSVVLRCSSLNQAQFVRANQRKIHSLIKQITPELYAEGMKLTVRTQPPSTRSQ